MGADGAGGVGAGGGGCFDNLKNLLYRNDDQLQFMRIHKPNWVAQSTSPLAVIVQDTAHAARSVQGLFPDLCLQAALFAGGCRAPHWSDCSPPVRVEKASLSGNDFLVLVTAGSTVGICCSIYCAECPVNHAREGRDFGNTGRRR